MGRTLLISIFALLDVVSIRAETAYNDVAIVINTNSSASQTIGHYFRVVRNIPLTNVIYVQVDTTEEIDSTMFNVLRSQVEDQLILNNIKDSVNYLVTTKGVPLKVNRGSTFSQSSPSSSVESELMLILGTNSISIGGAGPQMSPYFYQNAHFSRVAYGMYLVTRLDGYTVSDVLNLIDRSGPNITVNPQSIFLFDQDPAWSSPLNTYMARAKTTLEGRGKIVSLDATTAYQTNQQNLIGYMSWGSNDHYQYMYTQNAIPHNTYTAGAIAETYVSTSGRSFNNPPAYGQSLVADLIREGISGVKGYVYEPYSNAMAHAYILFDRYTANYNLAESYFMASLLVSWMDVVIGDPKTSIVFAQGQLPVQLAEFNGTFVSQNNSIAFNWRTISEINNYGFAVQQADTGTSNFVDVPNSFVAGHGTTLTPQQYTWTYNTAPAGTHYYRLRQIDLDGTQHFTDQITVTSEIVNAVEESKMPHKFELGQNYPNPFNPMTNIRWQMGVGGFVSVKVYDVRGKEVATIVNEDLAAGNHQHTFDATGLSSGVYYYRIQAGDLVETKRMTLLK